MGRSPSHPYLPWGATLPVVVLTARAREFLFALQVPHIANRHITPHGSFAQCSLNMFGEKKVYVFKVPASSAPDYIFIDSHPGIS